MDNGTVFQRVVADRLNFFQKFIYEVDEAVVKQFSKRGYAAINLNYADKFRAGIEIQDGFPTIQVNSLYAAHLYNYYAQQGLAVTFQRDRETNHPMQMFINVI